MFHKESGKTLLMVLDSTSLQLLEEYIKLVQEIDTTNMNSLAYNIVHSSREKVFKMLCLIKLAQQNSHSRTLCFKSRIHLLKLRRQVSTFISLSKVLQEGHRYFTLSRFRVDFACNTLSGGAYETMPLWPYGYLDRLSEINYGVQGVSELSGFKLEDILKKKLDKEKSLLWFDHVKIMNCRVILHKHNMFRIEISIHPNNARESSIWYLLAFHSLVDAKPTAPVGSLRTPPMEKFCSMVKEINRVIKNAIGRKQLYNLFKELIDLKYNGREKEFMELCGRLMVVENHKAFFANIYKFTYEYWTIDQAFIDSVLFHNDCEKDLTIYFSRNNSLDNMFALLNAKCASRKIQILALEASSIRGVKVLVPTNWEKNSLKIEFWNLSPLGGGTVFFQLKENLFRPELSFIKCTASSGEIVLDEKILPNVDISLFMNNLFHKVGMKLMSKLHSEILKLQNKGNKLIVSIDLESLVLKIVATSAVSMVIKFNRWRGWFEVQCRGVLTNQHFSLATKSSLVKLGNFYGPFHSTENIVKLTQELIL
jgi:hypothetical protein